MSLQHSKKKKKMLIIYLLYEPLHIVFTIMKDFLRKRIKVYQYIIWYFREIMKPKEKENDIFDRYYNMAGFFNEIPKKSYLFFTIYFIQLIITSYLECIDKMGNLQGNPSVNTDIGQINPQLVNTRLLKDISEIIETIISYYIPEKRSGFSNFAYVIFQVCIQILLLSKTHS